MFGLSLGKILVLAAILIIVWKGFQYIGQWQRLEKGGRRPAERSMGERMRRATRNRQAQGAKPDSVEETEKCRLCGAYVSLTARDGCARTKCPY